MEAINLHRRKKYFINKEFQIKFIVKFCILVIIGAVISGLFIYFMATSTLTTAFENSRLVIKSTADYILPSVLLASSVMIVIVGIAAILVTLFASHKIAGPLFRMEKEIKEIAQGNLNIDFHLRKNDQLKKLAMSLQEMTNSLKKDMKYISDTLESLDQESSLNNIKSKTKNLQSFLKKYNIG